MNRFAQLIVTRLIRQRMPIFRGNRVRTSTHSLHIHTMDRVSHSLGIVVAADCIAVGRWECLSVATVHRGTVRGLVFVLVPDDDVVLIVQHSQFPEQRLQMLIVFVAVRVVTGTDRHLGQPATLLLEEHVIRIAGDLRGTGRRGFGRCRVLRVIDGQTVVGMLGSKFGTATLTLDPRCFVEVDFGANSVRGADGKVGFGGLCDWE